MDGGHVDVKPRDLKPFKTLYRSYGFLTEGEEHIETDEESDDYVIDLTEDSNKRKRVDSPSSQKISKEDPLVIPVPNVSSATMKEMLRFAHFMKTNPTPFVLEKYMDDEVVDKMINRLTTASDYLEYTDLFEACCKKYAQILDNAKGVERIRKCFNVKSVISEQLLSEIQKATSFCKYIE
jgi:hypothetical protein